MRGTIGWWVMTTRDNLLCSTTSSYSSSIAAHHSIGGRVTAVASSPAPCIAAAVAGRTHYRRGRGCITITILSPSPASELILGWVLRRRCGPADSVADNILPPLMLPEPSLISNIWYYCSRRRRLSSARGRIVIVGPWISPRAELLIIGGWWYDDDDTTTIQWQNWQTSATWCTAPPVVWEDRSRILGMTVVIRLFRVRATAVGQSSSLQSLYSAPWVLTSGGSYDAKSEWKHDERRTLQ